MRVIVSGGGTGGHIYPAIALVHEIQRQEPDSAFMYIGTKNGLEKDIVEREHLPFHALDITGFRRKISIENVKTVMRFLKGVSKSKSLIHKFAPDVVIGTGGYVCGPVVYAAAKLHVPTVIHEQNSVPGLTNKFLSKYVDHVALSMEEADSYFTKGNTVLTGNPRASEILNGNGKIGIESVGLKTGKKTVLVFGGSRGARPINEAVIELLPTIATKDYQLIYITGEVHYEQVIAEVNAQGKPENISIQPFIHNMPDVLAGVDLVVSRAGATSLAEFTALALPSILIPSPYVTNNHQEKNARALEKHGAAKVITESELTGASLHKAIDDIMSNPVKRETMMKKAKEQGIPDAAHRLYQLIRSGENLK
ncbi:UDP-N-acetylglucosamine--N-acetylmuramyl-(pentapeptide) pyrophosphoryl-undecaprenol N-acetylglucosamine transferase [Pullulanibacillus pueri]|uniref:UDP-N-acetylglucosamine--N-acetylmuramyl-(pentapeptide) pyrophosphoryl-undecaprenol N-acetylglucosamine transferase n=1 Tax=Pullulanibacillus pueri TaxID=1437324 RepID=A0A8J3EKZ7_9BACL|nr:undecaprenyldiphospho-muramoylpentapeptide beta-N-acetylglucosaminyltransferase [Pullulanibacillus pueri]MBM7680135.1 UDP-N-acetylglucosamine--N-acetylmuramyl-(pentapeptide) pyrophosphoryl-undecaprenol N-acetylglucosamine transferase [Pullulanibacillus pueri]GGH74521.1 UDP-N-acetylglucosamine--N-acetylmuramyl-(pentapeptide) pyrophosphoryl-undecaprenol N-acetylglucosamine transferase 1 [Pullulanibacillus pueri]